MDSLVISVIAFALISGATLMGLRLHKRFPDRLSGGAKDSVRAFCDACGADQEIKVSVKCRPLKLWIGLALVSVLVGYYAISPFFVYERVLHAIESQDAETLAFFIDFPALREDLRAKFLVMMINTMGGGEMKGNLFAGLGVALGGGLVNSLD